MALRAVETMRFFNDEFHILFHKWFISTFEIQVTLNPPIPESVQNNTALPYGKQLRYKPHPVHEWNYSCYGTFI